MKKLKQTIRVDLPPSNLYVDDVQRIAGLLAHVCKGVHIETPEYRLDEVAELTSAHSAPLHELSIQGTEPYVSVQFSSPGSSFYGSAEDGPQAIAVQGLARQVLEVVESRRPLWGYFVGWRYLMLSLSPNLPVFLARYFPARWMVHTVAGCLLSLTLFVGYKRLKSWATINPKLKAESPSWWKVDSEKLILGTITTAIGAVIGALIKAYFEKH
jgi:hypothetical protein